MKNQLAHPISWCAYDIKKEIRASLYRQGLEYEARQYYPEAVAYYQKAAEKGHSEAQYCLGVCYAKGKGVSPDPVQAVTWYRKAAEQDNARALYRLGNGYYHGLLGIQPNIPKAVMYYRRAAYRNHATAQFNLGYCYASGTGVSQTDLRQAVIWYRRAAAQGHTGAQFNLGVCYDNGHGVVQNAKKAFFYYWKAAVAGEALAQYNLGCSYEQGEGVTPDLVEAVFWYRQAGMQGHPEAQFNLGRCYDQGSGVARNPIRAGFWYQKAAKQEYMAAHSLPREGPQLASRVLSDAIFYYAGYERVQNDALAVEAAHQALTHDAQNYYACVCLAWWYHRGTSVHPRNDREALAILQPCLTLPAAVPPIRENPLLRSVYATAYYLASALFLQGQDISVEPEKARFYAGKAVLCGDPAAQTAWALYLQYNGALAQAIGYFILAAEQGWIPAQWHLAAYFLEQGKVQSAGQWLACAYVQGYAPAAAACEKLSAWGVSVSLPAVQGWYQAQSEKPNAGPHIYHALGRVKEAAGERQDAYRAYHCALFSFCHVITWEYWHAQARQRPFTLQEEMGLKGIYSLPVLSYPETPSLAKR